MKKHILTFGAVLIVFAIILFFQTNAFAVDRNEKLLKGDKDKYILELQQALFKQGFLKITPTGYYGTDTESAVMEFQKKKNLKVDGKAGPETRKALLGDKYYIITEKRNIVDKSDDSGVEKMYSGDSGPDIEKLQKRLGELGYYTYEKITGYFGPATQTAVERFQRVHQLKIDGIVGESTFEKLNALSAKNYTMYAGDRGDDIKAMQKKLIALGYYNGTATGYFGTTTEAVIRLFQKTNGLTADGKAGKNTLSVLNSNKAKKNTGKAIVAGNTKAASTIDKIIDYAKTFQGRKYVLGGNGPKVFDCSGFVRYVLKSVGIALPRTSDAQSKVSKYKTIDSIGDLKRGDLMFFKTSSKEIGHVGIYLGGGKFIHCAPKVGVKIETLVKGRYYYDRFRWGKRQIN